MKDFAANAKLIVIFTASKMPNLNNPKPTESEIHKKYAINYLQISTKKDV